MASITIRTLENSVKAKLRMRAVSHGRSMELVSLCFRPGVVQPR